MVEFIIEQIAEIMKDGKGLPHVIMKNANNAKNNQT